MGMVDTLAPMFATGTLRLGSHHDDQQTDVTHTSSRPTLVTLPIETILRILSDVTPEDLVRLRAVCIRLRDIIDDPSLVVWKASYPNSSLPLPPGPLPRQSARTLRRTIIESDRLRRTWTSQPLVVRSTVCSNAMIKGPKTQERDQMVLIRGRWALWSREMKEIGCLDMETGYDGIVWQGEGESGMSQWAACDVGGDRGHLVYVAIRVGPLCRLTDPVKLHEYEVDDDTGRLTGPVACYDVPTASLPAKPWPANPRVEISASIHSSLVQIFTNVSQNPKHTIIFDSRTRRFYIYPPFPSTADGTIDYTRESVPRLVEIYPTTKHILVLSHTWVIEGPRQLELVQAFALPDDADTDARALAANADADTLGVRTLCLTHEHLHDDFSKMARTRTLVRNAVVDPVTKTSTFRFLHMFVPSTNERSVQFVCVDYILPQSDNAQQAGRKDVASILVESHEVFRLNDGRWRCNFVEASDEGHVRGMTTMGKRRQPDDIYKFEVDATGERCIAVVGDPSPHMHNLDLFRSDRMSFDGFRGKFSFKRHVREKDNAGEVVKDEILAYVVDVR